MGITKGKWSTLLTELMAFKELFDANAPLSQALPGLAAEHPAPYGNWGLRDLCDALHAFNREFRVAEVMREMYVDLPEPAMTPAEAYNHLVRGEIERVDIDQISGRVAGTMLVPYPPGIPTIMPGERFGAQDEPIIQSLRIAREQNARFPGFESDVHGLIIDNSGEQASYKVEVLKL
ncbi:Biodegradative arginine decarboxylase [compost metagenome]